MVRDAQRVLWTRKDCMKCPSIVCPVTVAHLALKAIALLNVANALRSPFCA